LSKFPAGKTVVFGVSADTVESHKGFVAKEHLNFPLLADPTKTMIAAYGVLGANGFANRVTFIIGPDGKISHIDRAVNAEFERGASTLTTRHGDNLKLLLSNWRAEIGKPVPNLSLQTTDDQSVSLQMPGKKATVILFLGVNCPTTRAYRDRLNALTADPANKDVNFLGIDPNGDETPAMLATFGKEQGYTFPLVHDADGELTRRFHVSVTPTVWVLNRQGVAAYTGEIDDNIAAERVQTSTLKTVLDAVLTGKAVTLTQTKAFGTRIRSKRNRQSAERAIK
jgi:peroxiredoxin